MAGTSSRVPRRALPALLAAAVFASVSPALAEPSCERIAPFAMSLANFRYALHAPADDDLGMEFRGGALAFAFASNGCKLVHGAQLLDVQAPDYGDPESRIYHVLGYRLTRIGPWFHSHVGVRLLTFAGGALGVVTPTAGVRVTGERMSLALDLELPGLYAVSTGDRSRSLLHSAYLSAIGTIALSPRLRLEGRAAWRDYRGLGLTRDVTLAAGLGFAPVARDHLRGLPGFVGLGARGRTTGGETATQVLLLLEFNLGVGGD